MDRARADILAARHRLHTRGWIPRHADAFRHLPPPGAEVWLGETPPAITCAAHPLAGAGWTLHPIGHGPQGRVDARWLDAGDALQRDELFAGLTMPAGVHDVGDQRCRAICLGPPRAVPARPAPAHRRRTGCRPRPVRHHVAAASPPAAQRCRGAAAGDRGARGRARRAGRDTRPQQLACGQPIVQNLQIHIRLGAGATLQHLRIAAPGASRPRRPPRARPPRRGCPLRTRSAGPGQRLPPAAHQ
jgi:Fe-S cluster assembly protein SufD